MRQVYSAADPADAHMVCQKLQSNGIDAVVQGENLWGARGELPFGPENAPSVWVREEDAAQALDLIHGKRVGSCFHCGYDLRGSPGPNCSECGQPIGSITSETTTCVNCGQEIEPGSEVDCPVCGKPHAERWDCPSCGESIEAQFTECWNCAGDAESA